MNGWVVLVYNMVRTNTPFLAACHQFYETYLENAGDEQEDTDIITPFFGAGNFTERLVDGVPQCFNFEGLAGRVLSRAVAPEVGHQRHEVMMQALRSIFDRYQHDGEVRVEYDTQVIYGRLPSP